MALAGLLRRKVHPWDLLLIPAAPACYATVAGLLGRHWWAFDLMSHFRLQLLVVLGDLNTSPWSHFFRRLLRDGGLRDGGRGRGWQPTWPTAAWHAGRLGWLLSIPIDHFLHAERIRVSRLAVGPHLGSDHRPVVVDVTVEPGE